MSFSAKYICYIQINVIFSILHKPLQKADILIDCIKYREKNIQNLGTKNHTDHIFFCLF